MKICMVTEFYLPSVGGIPFHVYYLSKELKKRGHEVTILTSGDRKDNAEKDVVRIGRGVPVYINGSIARFTLDFSLTTKIKSFFIKNNFDIIHIHGIPAPTLPYMALKYGRGRVVFTFHSYMERSLYYKIFKNYLNKILQNTIKIAVSEAAAFCTSRYIKGRFYIIPNGIELKEYFPSGEKFRNPTVLFIGRFEPRKGVTLLMDAIPLIREKINNVKFIMVGTGPLLPLIKKRMKTMEGVEFLGKISEKKKIELLRKSHLLVVPSTRGESFGIVLLEGMATGTPVLASDIPGYRCVIRNLENGILFPPKDPPSLARSVIEILSTPSLYKRIRLNGLKEVKKYSWENIAEKIERVYDSGVP